MLRCFGVALHETFHGKHTKRWAIEHDIALSESENPDDRQLAIDRRLLEEPRMEAHGVREHPPGTLRGRFVRHALRAAVTDVILPAFAGELLAAATAGRPLTRDMAGRATVYLQARTHYGILDPTVLDGAAQRVAAGSRRPGSRGTGRAVRQAHLDPGRRARARSTAPPASTARSSAPPDPPPSADRDDSEQRRSPASGGSGDRARGGLARRGARAGARAGSASGQLEQLDADLDLQQVLADAAAGRTARPARRSGRGTGMPTGRMPDRGVDRPPAPDEVQHARRYATRLRQALTHGTRRIDKRTPGGRFDGRAYTRGKAQRQTGRPVSTHPWRITRQVTAPIQEPHVGLVIDTSGSMGAYEYALGPICWILTDGLRQIGGRCATALFGNSVALLADGTRPLPLVPGSGPAAAPRSPATRSSCSANSSR